MIREQAEEGIKSASYLISVGGVEDGLSRG